MASPRSAQRASTGATVALAALLAVAAFMVVMPLVMASTPAVELGAPLAPQHQRGETLSYLVGFAVLCPLALLAAQRLAPALAGRAGDAGLSALLAVLAAGLLGAIVLVKALERAGGERRRALGARGGGRLVDARRGARRADAATASVARARRAGPPCHPRLGRGRRRRARGRALLRGARLDRPRRARRRARGGRPSPRRSPGASCSRSPVAGGAGCSTCSSSSRSWRWCRTC